MALRDCFSASRAWVFGFGFLGLGFGFWVLGSGVLVLGFGVLVLVLGFCLTCFGLLAFSCVLSARQLCAAEPLYWLSRCIIRSANYLLTFLISRYCWICMIFALHSIHLPVSLALVFVASHLFQCYLGLIRSIGHLLFDHTLWLFDLLNAQMRTVIESLFFFLFFCCCFVWFVSGALVCFVWFCLVFLSCLLGLFGFGSVWCR